LEGSNSKGQYWVA